MIAPTGATSVSITFTQFDTEPLYDTVTVAKCYSSSCLVPEVVTVLSGRPSTLSYTINSGYVVIQFDSDLSVTGSGFEVMWSSASTATTPVSFFSCGSISSNHVHMQQNNILFYYTQRQLCAAAST